VSLALVEPGARKGNRNYIFRGRVAGKVREIATDFGPGTPTRVLREAAAKAERAIFAELEAGRVPRPGEATTFSQATVQYLAWRDPETKMLRQRQWIDKLLPALGDRLLADITAADIVTLARDLYPDSKPQSLNSCVIIPAAAVIHFAARNNWCAHIQIPQFKFPRPRARDVSDQVAEALINNLPAGPKRLLLLWLFRQGDRVSDPLGVTWDNIDLRRQVVKIWIEKQDEEIIRPLHPDVFEALAAVPEAERGEYLFPWRQRRSVYSWLNPYTKGLGVSFTPHQARHTVGRQLNSGGVPLRTAMQVLGHKDPRSTLRYQKVDEAAVRSAFASVGKAA
jgi:integrase